MHRVLSCLWAGVLVAAASADAGPAAAAERRVALVIGNAAYAHTTGPKTSPNDAKLVAQALREIGFTEVLEHYDVGLASMTAALEAFGARAEGADWAVIYYAGHGLQLSGTSYLVPTDAKLATESEVAQETVPLGRLLEKPARAPKLRLLMLDTPRTNPFAAGPRPLRPAPAAKEPSPEGDMLIVFATGPGKVLPESAGDNGPFALALVRHMAAPGADIHDVFKRVSDDVIKATNRQQTPWTYGSLSGRHEFVAAPR